MKNINWINNNNRKVIKVVDLKEDICGVYEGFYDGKFSPIYKIQGENAYYNIIGCKDLNDKMRYVEIGSVIIIKLENIIDLENGFQKAIVGVGVCEEVID